MKSKCVIIAGEMSADILGSEIISNNREIDWFGVGGPLMRANNLKKIINWEKISAFGLTDVIFRLPSLLFNAFSLANKIIDIKPKLIITVDTKGFNFFLIKIIRKKIKNINYKPKFIHLVAPTVWAWRPNRAKRLNGLVDKLLCLFPNETGYFRKFKINAEFVGHPAVQNFSLKKDRKSLFALLEMPDNGEIIISLLPGSRASEVKKILPILISTVGLLKNKIKKPILFVLQAALNQENLIKHLLYNSNDNIIVLGQESARSLLTSSSDYSIITSGTATLEYSLSGVPSIAIYKTNFISAAIGRNIINMDNIILPNWILGKKVMDFLFQEECNAKNISEKMISLIYDKEKQKNINNFSSDLKKLLTANNKTFNDNLSQIIKQSLA